MNAQSANPRPGESLASGEPEMKPRKPLVLGGVILTVAVGGLLVYLYLPDRLPVIVETSWTYFVEAAIILIPVAVWIGMFEVLVPKALISQYLGQQSGWKGVALAFLFGIAPTGPIYVAFPIAALLLKKGASVRNIIIFLNTWAAMKLPQLLIEAQFLGMKFMLIRVALTIPATLVSAYLLQRFLRVEPDPISPLSGPN